MAAPPSGSPPHEAAKAGTIVIRTRDGQRMATDLAADAAGRITVGKTVIAADDWYEIRFASRPGQTIPPVPKGAHLEFANGDRLGGTLAECDGSRIVWKPGFSEQTVRFPASSLRRIWFADAPEWPDNQRVPPLKDRDQFLRKSGDRQTGTLKAIEAGKTLLYQSAEQTNRIPTDQLQCVILNSDLTRERPIRGRHYRITFTDGSRLTATQWILNGDRCAIKTAFQQDCQCDAKSIDSVRVVSGMAVPLNQLTPMRYEYSSFSGERFPLGVARRPDGGPMTLRTPHGTETYDSGWSLHAPAVVDFAVPKGAIRFEATAGLDAVTGRRGRVTLSIATDPAAKSDDLSKPTWTFLEGESQEISLDLTKAKIVRIRVAATGVANVQGVLNLGNARIILGKSD
jgi:NPCBM/NEW2 domain